jgi:hypothetical protein
MDEEIQPIVEQPPANLTKIDAIADRLMLLANQLLESKLSRASAPSSTSTTTTMEPPEEESFQDELEADQNLILLAAPLFARLKSINRSSSSMVSSFKSQTQLIRNQVDQIHLDLQNLIYERRHLEKEIKKCQEFELSPFHHAFMYISRSSLFFREKEKRWEVCHVFIHLICSNERSSQIGVSKHLHPFTGGVFREESGR